MGAVAGGGPFRAIVAELADEVVLVRWLQTDEPDPTDAELASLAEGIRLGAADWNPKYREYEMANGGLGVNVRVVGYLWAGPFKYMLTPQQQMALAGLNDDGTIG